MNAQLEMAEQQLLGYAHAKQGYSIIQLVESMGLNKTEWHALSDSGLLQLSDSDFLEVESYFS